MVAFTVLISMVAVGAMFWGTIEVTDLLLKENSLHKKSHKKHTNISSNSILFNR